MKTKDEMNFGVEKVDEIANIKILKLLKVLKMTIFETTNSPKVILRKI